MQRTLIALMLCLTAVAMLTRFQARLVDPLEMSVHYDNSGTTLDYELHETVEGADYHVTLVGTDQKKIEGSGHISAQELERFKDGLERQRAWALPNDEGPLAVCSLSLRQGQRSHQARLGIKNLTFTTGWLFHKDNLLVTSIQKAVASPR